MRLQSNIETLRDRKKALGWTNNKLSRESGIPVGTLNKIFNGATRNPREKTLFALAGALGVDYYQIRDMPLGTGVLRERTDYHPTRTTNLANLSTFYSLPKELRAELIDGKIYYRTGPGFNHQIILSMVSARFAVYLEVERPEARAFLSGCSVRLDTDEYTMVQPDFFVVNDKKRVLPGSYCMGAPDFVLEVAEEDDLQSVYEIKRFKYQNAGVKEYWIIDPVRRRIVAYAFAKDALPTIYSFEEEVKSYLYPDFKIDFEKIAKRLY